MDKSGTADQYVPDRRAIMSKKKENSRARTTTPRVNSHATVTFIYLDMRFAMWLTRNVLDAHISPQFRMGGKRSTSKFSHRETVELQRSRSRLRKLRASIFHSLLQSNTCEGIQASISNEFLMKEDKKISRYLLLRASNIRTC
jgi:hypothetical protein